MAEIKIIENPISLDELKVLAKYVFGDMIKCVVDLETGVMAVGPKLHAYAQTVMLDRGSKAENLWGFNIYVNQPRGNWLEFNSMINIRPSDGNPTRDIESEEIRGKIRAVVERLVKSIKE